MKRVTHELGYKTLPAYREQCFINAVKSVCVLAVYPITSQYRAQIVAIVIPMQTERYSFTNLTEGFGDYYIKYILIQK